MQQLHRVMHRAGRSQPDPHGEEGGKHCRAAAGRVPWDPHGWGRVATFVMVPGRAVQGSQPSWGGWSPPQLSRPGTCAGAVCRAQPWGVAPPRPTSAATVLRAPPAPPLRAPSTLAVTQGPSRRVDGSWLAPSAEAGAGHGAGAGGPRCWESRGQSLRMGCRMPWGPRLLLRAPGSFAVHAASPVPWCSGGCFCRCV